MYAALDLHEKSIQCVLKDDQGQIVRESKMGKDEEKILGFLDGTQARVVMESGYNHQHIYDVLKKEGYDVTVAHPLLVKAIAYARLKNDKVDARMLADLPVGISYHRTGGDLLEGTLLEDVLHKYDDVDVPPVARGVYDEELLRMFGHSGSEERPASTDLELGAIDCGCSSFLGCETISAWRASVYGQMRGGRLSYPPARHPQRSLVPSEDERVTRVTPGALKDKRIDCRGRV